ncbi:hypothetical protein ACFL6B_01930 [Thermodesulfobacteriota bacterium]
MITEETQKRLVSIFLIIVSYYSLKNPILFSFLATGYHSQFVKENSKIEKSLWSISSTLPILMLSIETLQPWGLPYGIIFIWWWGLGYLTIVILLFIALRDKTFFIVSAICVLSFLVCEYAQLRNTSPIFFLKNESSKIKYTNDNLKTISENIKLVDEFDKKTFIKNSKYIVPLIDYPTINENYFKKMDAPASILLFAEHDNIGNFIDDNSSFNDDSYKRKTPWIAYKPFFRTDLNLMSKKDPLYCSNIGCTIKWDPKSYPIVWDYKRDGTPILLSTGKIIGNKHFVLFGDSDPIVPFLIPYNPEFLRKLFGETDYRLILEILPVIFASIFIFIFRKGFGLVFPFGFVVLSILAGFLPSSVTTNSDINFITNLEIHNPHYDFSYSSLPKKLANEGYSVTINQRSKSKIEVHVIEGSNTIKYSDDQRAIVFMNPNSMITLKGNKISAGDLPLGNFKDRLKGRSVAVEDARSILVNGIKTGRSIFDQNNYIFVGSGSAQKNIDLIKVVLEKKH